MGRNIFAHTYEEIISIENLLEAWREFVTGKRSRRDAQEFERNLMANLLDLHDQLAAKRYRHGGYEAFAVSDPKPRSIHKATVGDRVVHRAIYRKLCPFFDRLFIADSFSCRVGEGTHAALDRFRAMTYKVSRNHTRTAWVLKCDIRKFFASIDHGILMSILAKRIQDRDVLRLVGEIIVSFPVPQGSDPCGTGLPLGNLTSQIFANIYMNELDQFMKRRVRAGHYIRYADDFAIIADCRDCLACLIPTIQTFLREQLKLELHPNKVFIKTVASGVDFLGWLHFPDHRVVRTATKRRMIRNLNAHPSQETTASYVGLMSHGNTHEILKKSLLGLRG